MNVLASGSFWAFVGVVAAIYTILALGLQVQFGFAGLLNFGQVAFMAIGAYTMAMIAGTSVAAAVAVPMSDAAHTWRVGLGAWALLATASPQHHLLARRHLGIDSQISPFLPPDWVKGPGVDTITFRDLLTHRAGFRLDSGLVFATDALEEVTVRQAVRQGGQDEP